MTDRIHAMEEKLNRCRAALDAVETALDAFDDVQQDLADLEAYYGSDDFWRRRTRYEKEWRMMRIPVGNSKFHI